MRKRLDVLLVERGLQESRQKAQATIMSGLVFVKGQRADKPGTSVDEAAEIVKSYRKKILLGFKNPVENPQAYPSSISELLEILDEYDDDSTFGLMLDLYETQTSEGGLSDALEKLMQFIGHIRIAGVPLRNEPDDGEVNYTYLLALLEAHGYAHAVSASYTPRAKTQTGLKWMKKFL